VVLLVSGDDVDDAERDTGRTGGQDQQLPELAKRIRCPCSGLDCEGFEVRQAVFRELRLPARAGLGG